MALSKAAAGGARARQGARGSRRRPAADRVLRWLAILCLIGGAALVAGFGLEVAGGIQHSRQLTSAWQRQQELTPPPAVPAAQPPPDLMRPVNGVDFAIRVPRLGYFAAVREGVDTDVLYSGPGHYPGTPWPGQAGMVAVAAHNVYWIDFPQLANGDQVQLETRYGTFRYAVTGSRVVEAGDRTILVQGAGRHLTLTTCWPTWAGSFATQRYVIFADQVWPAVPRDEHPGS